MTTQQEENKQVVRAYAEAFNRGNLQALRELFAPDAEIQGVMGKGQMDRIMPIWEELVSGLGVQLNIDDMVAQDDIVAVRYTESGTFRAPFFGQQPTGKSYELVAMEWFVVRDGKIRRRWGARDQASQARQLGMTLK